MASKVVKLNNGCPMPLVGLGTFKAVPGEVEQAVKDAIDAGYRHFDCAWFYGNEAEVGVGLRAKIEDGTVKREDLFITTKLWNNFHAKHLVRPKLEESLKSFQFDYIDLFLIHWPFAFKEDAELWPSEDKSAYSEIDYLETWQGMEECVTSGLAKNIGVSNFNSEQMDRLLKNRMIKPVINQIEVNVNLNQKKLIEFCKERDVLVVGYCPLGRGAKLGEKGTMNDPKIAEIGKKYNKSAAQVILNYLLSSGIAVIPKSATKSRIIANMDVFDFKLNAEDVSYLESCNNGERVCGLDKFAEHKDFPFGIEF